MLIMKALVSENFMLKLLEYGKNWSKNFGKNAGSQKVDSLSVSVNFLSAFMWAHNTFDKRLVICRAYIY